MTCHVTIQNAIVTEICPCAKFRFNYIFVARNIAKKHFSLKIAPDPGLKHLKVSDPGGGSGASGPHPLSDLNFLKNKII